MSSLPQFGRRKSQGNLSHSTASPTASSSTGDAIRQLQEAMSKINPNTATRQPQSPAASEDAEFKMPGLPRKVSALSSSMTPRTSGSSRSRTPGFPDSPSKKYSLASSSTAQLASSTTSNANQLEVGDKVLAMQFTGTLRVGPTQARSLYVLNCKQYLGPVAGKEGDFAGIELDNEFRGKGKNDGSVQGSVKVAFLQLDLLMMEIAFNTLLVHLCAASLPPPTRSHQSSSSPICQPSFLAHLQQHLDRLHEQRLQLKLPKQQKTKSHKARELASTLI